MGVIEKLVELAKKCAARVIATETSCRSFAGDRGFSIPELNSHGLSDLKNKLTGDYPWLFIQQNLRNRAWSPFTIGPSSKSPDILLFNCLMEIYCQQRRCYIWIDHIK